MNSGAFLRLLIDDGIEAAKRSYSKPHQEAKLRGALEGFEACRNKSREELGALLSEVRHNTQKARDQKSENYWWYRCYELEVEWVCNCVSALLRTADLPVIITPTERGMVQAGRIMEKIFAGSEPRHAEPDEKSDDGS